MRPLTHQHNHYYHQHRCTRHHVLINQQLGSRRKETATQLSAATGISLGDVTALSNDSPRKAENANEAYKVGVLFLNLGGPATGDDVEGTIM
jgi:hypothetical protein